MMKDGLSPTSVARSRRMRTQVEWNVAMSGGRIPAGRTRSSTRRRISPAALLVKVTASTCRGWTPSTPRSHAIRWAMTRVLPLPAPASTSIGPRVAWTACCWAGLSEASTLSGATADRSMDTYDLIAPARRRRPVLPLRDLRHVVTLAAPALSPLTDGERHNSQRSERIGPPPPEGRIENQPDEGSEREPRARNGLVRIGAESPASERTGRPQLRPSEERHCDKGDRRQRDADHALLCLGPIAQEPPSCVDAYIGREGKQERP